MMVCIESHSSHSDYKDTQLLIHVGNNTAYANVMNGDTLHITVIYSGNPQVVDSNHGAP